MILINSKKRENVSKRNRQINAYRETGKLENINAHIKFLVYFFVVNNELLSITALINTSVRFATSARSFSLSLSLHLFFSLLLKL